MEKKSEIDLFGASALTAFALLLAFNQVVIKITNGGIQPVFFAALRSFGALFCLYLWLRWRGIAIRFPEGAIFPGIVTGIFFSIEFLFLFIALDHTTVARSGIIFYSMPVWLALAGHIVLPDDRLTPVKALGLVIALGGVAWALLGRSPETGGSLFGDLAALIAAMGWAGLTVMTKGSGLKQARPEMQLLIQLIVSGPLLLLAAFFFGPFIRDLAPVHLAGLGFQIVIVVTAGYVFWLWLLSIYPASGVASFSFLSPVFSVILGWALLKETISPDIIVSLVLVAVGITLVNRPRRRRQVPQNV